MDDCVEVYREGDPQKCAEIYVCHSTLDHIYALVFSWSFAFVALVSLYLEYSKIA